MAETRSTRLAEFLGVLSFAVGLMLLISLATYNPHDPAPFFKSGAAGPARNFIGPVGAFLAELLVPQLFGLSALLLPLSLVLAGWTLFWCRPIVAPYTKGVGLLLLQVSLATFLTLSLGTVILQGEPVRAGGATGELLGTLLTNDFNRAGAFIVVVTALLVSLILSTQFSFATLMASVWSFAADRLRALRTSWAHYRESRRKESLRREVIRKHQKEVAGSESLPRVRRVKAEPEVEPKLPPVKPLLEAEEEAPEPSKPLPPPPKKGNYVLPPSSVLDEIHSEGGTDKEKLFERAKTLQAKCSEFGVLGNVVEIHPGPVVTTYEFKPDAGVKYSKIVGLSDDLALALEAESIRIDRMSGRGTVGIEIPNERRETISLREILESEVYRKSPSRMTLALGKTVSGETYVTDLAMMPHLLIAGATGTGKSVGLNCMIASLLFKASPDECRLILIDPKRLELGAYEDIPHLLAPVVTDAKVASNVLKWAVQEMENRIRRLASEGVRNIDQFNNIVRAEKASSGPDGEDLKPLHYIVIVIDELADLMMVSSHEVEESITRLAQMARAVGIHLILATQRPSVDVLTGLIKANFPSRISFRVAARVDSRTILDSIGAEHLLGKGDMLFLPPGSARLTRIHGAYVSEREITRLTTHLRKIGKPQFDENVGKAPRPSEVAAVEERDELFDEAARFVVQSGQASTSMLQRRFRIGFSRAGRLIDLMERDGIIGPADGARPREILVEKAFYETVDSWPK